MVRLGFFIFVVGVKLFPDKETKVSFKKVLIGVGFAHAPGLLRFFAVTPDLNDSNNFFDTVLDICRINNFNKTNS